MSNTHEIESGNVGFPLRILRGTTTCGTSILSLMCAVFILLGATNIPESKTSSTKNTPMEAMRSTVGQALGVLQDQELQKPGRVNEKVTRLKRIADSRFDYGEMAKRSLGGQWDKLEERQRQEFVDLFTELLTTTYLERIHTYSGEEVTFLSERIEGNHAEVKSIMVGKKSEIPLDYRLMMKGDDWKAYDVVVDGISLVRNYRGQFAAILRSSSYEQLIKTLREKNAQYNVKTKTSDTSMSSH